MTQGQLVSMAGLPAPLRWHGVPQKWALDADNALTMTAGQRTDWFIDPADGSTFANAPALLMKTHELCMLKAHVTVEYAATYDAGVLAVYQADRLWGEVCLELSPQGQLMIVSVVTKDSSDDCNSVPIAGKSVYLRLAKLERAYAFHYSLDGHQWNMVRYFTLGGLPEVEIGFLVQSPRGDACTAIFREIAYVPQKLSNIRSGE